MSYTAPGYEHTQKAPMVWVLLMLAACAPFLMALAAPDEVPVWAMFVISLLLVIVAFCFRELTVVDAEQSLLVKFGPLPLFRKRIFYDEITDFVIGETSWIDGWGIHYVPWRGWTYNLWGFSCVRLRMGRRRIQIGTDDPQGLAAFLEARLAARLDDDTAQS